MDLNTHSGAFEQLQFQYAGIADGAQTGLDLATDALTFEAWGKMTAGGPSYLPILGKSQYAGNNQSYEWGFIGNDLYLRISDDGASLDANLYTLGDLRGDGWHHFATTWDAASDDMYVYFDGALMNVVPLHLMFASGIHDGTADFFVGRWGAVGDSSKFWHGELDEIRVWSHVRTPAEILTNYNVHLVGDEAGLVGYWRLDDDWLDETANNNDLTPAGGAAAPTFSTDVPFVGELPDSIPGKLIPDDVPGGIGLL